MTWIPLEKWWISHEENDPDFSRGNKSDSHFCAFNHDKMYLFN